jgi:hypothetical protein
MEGGECIEGVVSGAIWKRNQGMLTGSASALGIVKWRAWHA